MIQRHHKRTGSLLVILAWALCVWNLHTKLRAQDEVSSKVLQTVQELNHKGRLPVNGYVGGMVNNVWQTVSGHASELGCGGQAAELYTRLQGIPGWRFEMRYEKGIQSPILLPHQWVTGYGPNGEVVQLDPWAGEVQY